MKISQLAAYRETLEQLRSNRLDRALAATIDPIIHLVANHAIQMPTALHDIRATRDQAQQSIDKLDQQVQLLLTNLLDQIKNLEPHYLARSYQLYEEGRQFDSTDYILDRPISINDDDRAYIQSRVQAHSNWHYAGMIIRPGRETWIEHMVACDPLYLVDTSHDLLAPAKQLFTPLYQNRLRYYVIKESATEPMLSQLPQDQFGFCLAYNFFHYKPFEIMRGYLTEIYQKLRPGGVVGITFNDCDRRGAVELAESMFACYTPGRMVLALCESVGFVIEKNYQLDAAVNWVEMRKPGQMATLRGGQSLARIVAKSK